MLISTGLFLALFLLTIVSSVGHTIKNTEFFLKEVGGVSFQSKLIYLIESYRMLREFYYEIFIWIYVGVRLAISLEYREKFIEEEKAENNAGQDN